MIYCSLTTVEKQLPFFTEVNTNTYQQNNYLQQSHCHLEGNVCDEIIIYKQLSADHLAGFKPMKRQEKVHQMIITFTHVCVYRYTCKRLSLGNKSIPHSFSVVVFLQLHP